MKHSLSIYHISIYERRRKNKRVRLDNIDGVNFLNIIDSFIAYWLKGKTSIQKSEKDKKACRLVEENGHQQYEFRSSVIEGIIESGEYGQEIDVYDVDDGSKKSTIQKRQAPLLPFYFFISIEEDSYDGYLILQRIGNSGIYSILTDQLIEYASKNLPGDYTIKIVPFVSTTLRNNTFKLISEARSVTIQNKKVPEMLDSLGLGSLESDGVKNEIKYYLPQSRTFKIPSVLRQYFKREDENSTNDKVEENESTKTDIANSDSNAIEDFEITMEAKMPDGKFRKLTLGNINSLGSSQTLPEDISCNDKGFPLMKEMRKEAFQLLQLIKDSQNDHKNKK